MNALCKLLLLAALAATPASRAPATRSAPVSAAPAPVELLEHLDQAGEGNDGEWADYALLLDGKPVLEATVRVMLAADPVDGQVWFELWLDKTGRNAVRARDGSATLLKMGGSVFEMPGEEGQPAESPCTAPGGACRPMSSAERELARKKPDSLALVRLEVVAGTFSCQKTVRGTGKHQVQLWKSTEVPGIHLVRALYPEGHGFELVAFGKHGRSSFPARIKATRFPFQDLKNLERLMPSMPPPPAAPAAANPTSASTPVP